MNFKFSVVIPAYNAERFIQKALESVVNQTYKNIEIVVVNDGSTDATGEIVERFFKENESVDSHLVNIENNGLANARNVGIKHASGDYFCNLDADDYLECSIFEKISKICVPFDVCFYGFDEVDENTRKVLFQYKNRFSYIDGVVSGEVAALKKMKKEIWICQGNAVYSLDMVRRNNIWNIKGINQGEDLYFIMRALMCAKGVCSVPFIAFHCTLRKDSMMHSAFNDTYLETLRAYKLLLKDIQSYSFLKEEKEMILLHVNKSYFFEHINIAKRICDAQGVLGVIRAMHLIEKKCFSVDVKFSDVKKVATFKERFEYLVFSNSSFLFFYFCKLYRLFYA